MTESQVKTILAMIATLAFLSLMLVANANAAESGSGIVKGPELKFGSIAKRERVCKVVEQTQRDGTVKRMTKCGKGR